MKDKDNLQIAALKTLVKELQQEVYDLKIKNYAIVELENKIEVQKEIIKALSLR
jgi:hypothetical protein